MFVSSARLSLQALGLPSCIEKKWQPCIFTEKWNKNVLEIHVCWTLFRNASLGLGVQMSPIIIQRAWAALNGKDRNPPTPNSMALNSLALNSMALKCMAQNYTALSYMTLNFMAMSCIKVICMALHYIALIYISPHCMAWRCMVLKCIDLSCMAVNYMEMYCITLICTKIRQDACPEVDSVLRSQY